MKTFNLRVPFSPVEIENKEKDTAFREKNYLDWKWFFLDEIISTFAEGIKKAFNFSYNDYYEYRDGDEYSFEFYADSIAYVIWIFDGEDKDDLIEYKIKFDAFENRKLLLFTRRIKSKQHSEKFKRIILHIIKDNNFTILKNERAKEV